MAVFFFLNTLAFELLSSHQPMQLVIQTVRIISVRPTVIITASKKNLFHFLKDRETAGNEPAVS